MTTQDVFKEKIKILDSVAAEDFCKVAVEVAGEPINIKFQTNFETANTVEDVLGCVIEDQKMTRMQFYDFIVEKISTGSATNINGENKMSKMLALMDVFSEEFSGLKIINNVQRFEEQIQIHSNGMRKVRVDFVNELGLKSFYIKTAFRATVAGETYQLEYARHWDDRLYINEEGNLREDSVEHLIEKINQEPFEIAFTQDAQEFARSVVEKARKVWDAHQLKQKAL